MAIIKFKGKEYHYVAEDVHDHGNPNYEDVKELLFKTKELLDEAGISFMLAYGTLLGAIREKDFIKHDPDIDLIVDDEEKLFNTLPQLHEKGLRLVRAKSRAYYSFRMNGPIYIDLYILSPVENFPWKYYCVRVEYSYLPAKFFREKQTIDFLGKDFQCPKNPERLIRYMYGKNWRTPAGKDSHYSHYEVFSHQLIRKPKKALKWLFRRIVGDKLYLKLKSRKNSK